MLETEQEKKQKSKETEQEKKQNKKRNRTRKETEQEKKHNKKRNKKVQKQKNKRNNLTFNNIDDAINGVPPIKQNRKKITFTPNTEKITFLKKSLYKSLKRLDSINTFNTHVAKCDHFGQIISDDKKSIITLTIYIKQPSSPSYGTY